MASQSLQVAKWIKSLDDGIEVAASKWVDEASEIWLDAIVAEWPGTNRAVHIYATDASKNAFFRVLTKHRAVISNEKRYSGYTDGGYTFRGVGTAKSYAARGDVDYGAQALDVARPKMDAAFDRLMDGVGNG